MLMLTSPPKDEAARRLQEELYPESAVLRKALQAQQQQAEV